MNSKLDKYKDFISIFEDKVRVLNLELIKEAEVAGFWVYEIIYFDKNEIKEDHVMGKDMSDALYRFSQIIELPLSRFTPGFLKK